MKKIMSPLMAGKGSSSELTKHTVVTSSTEVGATSPIITRTTSHLDTKSTPIQVTHAMETARKVRSRIVHEFGDVEDVHLERINLQYYIKYIADRRRTHIPKRGSQWDQVLKEAEFFGLQIDEFTLAVEDFIVDSTTVRDTALASCYLLLELGCDQAQALEPTFNTLYELGQLLANTLELRSLFTLSDGIANSLGEIVVCLVRLLGDITVFYHQRVSRLSQTSRTIQFDLEFGNQLEEICSKRVQLINTIWSYKLGSAHTGNDVALLHRDLGSTRAHIKSYLYGRIQEKKRRTEGTCEWLEDDLFDFLENGEKILAVTGIAGCGKSMLAGWVRDQLERPIGYSKQKHRTISFQFAIDHKEKSTIIAFLKSVLSQLLEISIGDSNLFNNLSSAVKKFGEDNNKEEFTNQMWALLDNGFATVNSKRVNLTLIIDGLDGLVGGDTAGLELFRRIHQSVKKLESIRAIIFSRPSSHIGQLDQPDVRHVVITPEQVHDDIQLYLKLGLSQHKEYTSQSIPKPEELLDELVSRAKESFLFAYLSLQLLATGTSLDSFSKFIHAINPELNNNHESLLKELTNKINLKDENANRLLTFMIVTERPFEIGEVEDLLSIDLSKRTSSSNVDVRSMISATGGLLIENQGAICFKHPIVRSYITQLCGSSLISLKDAHCLLTMTLLLHAKIALMQTCGPSIDMVKRTTIDQVYRSCPLVKFTVKYWVAHLQRSSFTNAKGDLELSEDFKGIFPDSILLVMLEWSSWQTQHAASALDLHNLALKVRTTCFGENNRTVLQNLIIIGTIYRTQSDAAKAADIFYRASSVGQAVMSKFDPLVITCTSIFLTCTEEVTYSERTTSAIYREEMLHFYIEVCKRQYGANSDQVIRWYEALIKLYRDICEEHTAAVILGELHGIITIRFGSGSAKEREITRKLIGIQVVLKRGKTRGSKSQDDELLFKISEDLELTDERRINIILNMAETYESQEKFTYAERLYIVLWSRICKACHQNATVELQVVQLNIALEYIHFLCRRKRESEACNIMVCIWAEYEHCLFASDIIVQRLKELSILFKQFGLLAVSMSILKKAWEWFKEHKMTESKEASETSITITEVVEKITETTTATTTTTTEAETVMREIYKTTYTRASSDKVDHLFFKACLALVGLHMRHENWYEAELVLQNSLELVWKGVLTVDEKITLEGDFISETVLTATRLALFYHRQRKFDKAEQIYLRVWRACFNSLKADHVVLTDVTSELLSFYRKYHRYGEVIEIHRQLLERYRKNLGDTHELTIQTLYQSASVYQLLGRKEAYDYYAEIITLYTHDRFCHRSYNIAGNLLRFCREENRWTDLKKLCEVLWETVTKHHHEFKISEEFIQLVYEQYLYVLEFYEKMEFSVLRKRTVEYLETVKAVFGVSVAIYPTALIALAEVCEKSQEHHMESVETYEKVITKTENITTVTETQVRTIKKRLSTLYVTIVTSGKNTETSTVERAIAVCSETYEQFKIQFGWWHETTLLKLKELVLLYSKLNNDNARATIVNLLQENIIKVLSTATVAMDLYEAAITLASIYKVVKLEREGHELLRQLRILILFPGFDIAEQNITIKLDIKPTRVTLVFLIALEEGLHQADGKLGPNHFSQLMADLLLETLLYEQYVSATTGMGEKTSIEIILGHGARLRSLWVTLGRESFVTVLDKKLFAAFKEQYAKILDSYSNDRNVVFELYIALLTEIGDKTATERTTVDFAMATVKAINALVRKLMAEPKEYPHAHAVAKCGFDFASSQDFYQDPSRGVFGYRLAEMLAGHGVPSWETADSKKKESMLAMSRNVLQTVFDAFCKAGVDVVSLRREDLSSLINLLADQKNYSMLETLLAKLWRSRKFQRDWSPAFILHIGQLLLDARVLASHTDSAIKLAKKLYYNVRQSHDSVDRQALNLANKLSVLLAQAGLTRNTGRIHIEVLHDLIEHSIAAGTDPKEKERLHAAADLHLDGLRRCGWAPRSWYIRTATELHTKLGRRYGGLTVPPVEKWGDAKKEKEKELKYPGPTTWSLDVEKETTGRDLVSPAKAR
ncbi:uncharacterized protein F4812DRAFT_100514 [Daldinia caldariorum]|uniref:uncharacterized protein n=1 Tax=Daldinia caldariorum TaxID=326644 RepID=UPI002008DA19|nr:uncharacterized protein F4812DRAFT_100514 [Daldinia caldariorum]KAI1466225.1 hypothetical protein F4812DRAFT_100514 [Daldinia caldariorum]